MSPTAHPAGTSLYVDRVESPVGPLLLASAGGTLRACAFLDRDDEVARVLAPLRALPSRTDGEPFGIRETLAAYFAGEVAAIDALAVETHGSPFQQRVWAELRRIPFGATLSYGELAVRVGVPTGARAVGLANGSNPVAVVVPCHRVIGANGALTGYGGGLSRKRWLLEHERRHAGDTPMLSLGAVPAVVRPSRRDR